MTRPAANRPPAPHPPRQARHDVVVFLGPSLPAAEARALGPCRVLPPARAGDLLAVLPERPLAVALVDGVFEAVPSVWQHELLAAQAAGVQVFGGASMGALRAAGLSPFGVVGVGRIFAAYRDGALTDDAEVALLHAGREHGFRPFTLPLVDARHAVTATVAAGACTAAEGKAVLAAAAACFYQERTWARVLGAARLSRAARERLAPVLAAVPSQKAEDARATVAAALDFAAARRAGAPAPPPPQAPPAPSQVRRQRLAAARAVTPGGRAVAAGRVLQALARRPDAGRLAAQGLRRALLASLARSLGLAVSTEEARAAEAAWLGAHGVGPDGRDAFLAACALDDGAARTLAEDLALEAALLAASERILPDGPSWQEGLALGARLTGAWAEAVLALSSRRAGASGRTPARARWSAPRSRASARRAPRRGR